jgi:hypothetical protein
MRLALALTLLLAACGSRTDGKPGEIELDESPPATSPPASCGEPGVRRCTGARREVCDSDGEWRAIETCESAAACEISHCNEAACQPSDIGTLRCTGSKWLGCTDGKMWQTVDVCDDVLTCCADE